MTTGLRTRARELNEQELIEMIHKALAVLVGAAYLMFDQAIALAIHNDLMKQHSIPQGGLAPMGADALHQLQRQLPRITAEISQNWVSWTAETEGNWRWFIQRCDHLQRAFEGRFRTEAPLRKEFLELYRRSPRPRSPGRTPFPQELC